MKRELIKPLIKRLLSQTTNVTRPDSSPSIEGDWSIGMYVGKSPLAFVPFEGRDNPVLTREHVSDIRATFVADPFMMRANDTWYMFFEVMNQETKKGEIGLATSKDGLKWTYKEIVLVEPFHLSYPYIFEWMNEFYMIPESFQTGSIRLYKALKFPFRWTFVTTLLRTGIFLDSSVFRYDGRWWLLTETNPDHKYDTLRLYYSDDLIGSWLEHPESPIIKQNAHIARPAGRVQVVNDGVIRYAQDCYPIYGTQVRAFEIIELTTSSYREREACENPILTASGKGWNRSGMHHIDAHLLDDGQWIACVDGYF